MYLGDMKPNPDRYIKYPLSWTAAMSERVAVMANQREMSMAVWIREAIREKLDRDEPAKEQELAPC